MRDGIALACSQNNNFLNAMMNIEQASQIMLEPFVLYKPKIFPDGDQWCVLLGDSIQEGVVGFGDTPREAAVAFNHNFDNQTLKATPTESVVPVHPDCDCMSRGVMREGEHLPSCPLHS